MEDYVKMAWETGLVVKIVPDIGQVFVEPMIWHQLDYEVKKKTAVLLARYCGMKSGMGGELVEIKDRYSGKTMAKIGLFGFKVY